ncbi:MAG TPA: hypothetical protein PLQ00_04595 [Thermoguttaceae bacterium]|nr:hypothetical protein [Thermoguttaceae bacterium]
MGKGYFLSVGVRITAMLVVVVVGATFGCGRKLQRQLPTTYPVAGRILAPAGQQIPVGARIEFRTDDPNMVAFGNVEPDGRFTLQTLYYEKLLPGAAAGRYKVTLLTTVNNIPGPVITIPEVFTVEPKENQFTVNLSAAKLEDK